ncbi:MAG: AsmA-like C-terminal region-containing protein, partial [Bacteroidales bacterium]
MKKIVKITGIVLSVILIVLILMICTPFIFREKFAEVVKNTANKSLKTEMNFSSMDVSFFHHFPNLTITLTDFYLKSSSPFSKDTLISARDISFGVDLASIIHGPIKITRAYLNKGRVIIKYNEKGLSNYDVYNSSSDTAKNEKTTSNESASIRIKNIAFIKTDFIYSDASIPIKITAHGINYTGKSKISKDILRLASNVQIDSLDFSYNHVNYLKSKPLKAKLVTIIDLNSLNMKFEKNDLHIKDIPFEFRGEFSFRKDGYTFFISMFSMFGDEYLSGSLWLVSKKNLWISLRADVNMDLQSWMKGFGLQDVDLKGLFSMKLKAEGEYITGQNPESSKPDTILLSIPDFQITSKISNGYFHYKKLPSSIDGISCNLTASSTNHDYRSVNLQLENLKARFMKNNIEGYIRLKGLEDFPVECHFSTRMNLAEIRQVIPFDSLDLKGILDAKLDVKGKYAPVKKLFPVTNIELNLKDGSLQTKYYPHPVENINLNAIINNQSGKLSDTRIKLDPISFTFEGNPFEVRGELSNPDNVSYSIIAKGSIDLAKIYHLFSQKGMDLDGFISADLTLKGLQSDALAGKYDKLQNSGRLVLKNISFRTAYLPKPLILKSGVFRFDNDNIWFEKFDSRFGVSDITLDGHLSNVVNYFLSGKQKLKGSFKFTSNYLLIDEFMTQEEPATNIDTNKSTGVIIIPDNLEMALKADIKKIQFQKLPINNLNANVEMKQGMILLKSMNFDIIGCKVNMDASYGSINTNRAFFDFHIKAEDFDIKRAYNEVELFRNLSSSAGKCEGTVSLDYSLKGRLDGSMKPIYPSLEGNGVLSLKKIKVLGLKLFTTMGNNLNKEKVKNPDLSKVDIKSSIKNNVITIEKTKLKFAGFRFRISGETNLNGSLNLKSRLGLPPLGIVGIPIRILGTQENPKFKYGRGNNDENVEETEYSDEIPKDVLDKIKNAKE